MIVSLRINNYDKYNKMSAKFAPSNCRATYQNPCSLFCRHWQTDLKNSYGNSGPRRAKIVLERKDNVGGFMLLDFKNFLQYYSNQDSVGLA